MNCVVVNCAQLTQNKSPRADFCDGDNEGSAPIPEISLFGLLTEIIGRVEAWVVPFLFSKVKFCHIFMIKTRHSPGFDNLSYPEQLLTVTGTASY
jgi:hypothetical protein